MNSFLSNELYERWWKDRQNKSNPLQSDNLLKEAFIAGLRYLIEENLNLKETIERCNVEIEYLNRKFSKHFTANENNTLKINHYEKIIARLKSKKELKAEGFWPDIAREHSEANKLAQQKAAEYLVTINELKKQVEWLEYLNNEKCDVVLDILAGRS